MLENITIALAQMVGNLGFWGYGLLFLITAAEAQPFMGAVIPGALTVMAGGFFVRVGVLSFWPVIGTAVAGAIVGDATAYFLGRYYGGKLIKKYGRFFFRKPERLEKLNQLIHAHPGKTLILGRFNSLTRAFAPFLVGSMRLPFERYVFFNIVGGIAWAVPHVILGYIFGESYILAGKYVGLFFLTISSVAILLLFGFRYLPHKGHTINRYYGFLLSITATFYLLVFITSGVVKRHGITRLDAYIHNWIIPRTVNWFTALMKLITTIGNLPVMLVASVVLVGWLAHMKRFKQALVITLGMTGGIILSWVLKIATHFDRPTGGLVKAIGFSFPSGHATMTTIFFSLLFYVFRRDVSDVRWRYVFGLGMALIVFLIALSRIYLGVHWFSDVVAGMSLGVFWVSLLLLSFELVA